MDTPGKRSAPLGDRCGPGQPAQVPSRPDGMPASATSPTRPADFEAAIRRPLPSCTNVRAHGPEGSSGSGVRPRFTRGLGPKASREPDTDRIQAPLCLLSRRLKSLSNSSPWGVDAPRSLRPRRPGRRPSAPFQARARHGGQTSAAIAWRAIPNRRRVFSIRAAASARPAPMRKTSRPEIFHCADVCRRTPLPLRIRPAHRASKTPANAGGPYKTERTHWIY